MVTFTIPLVGAGKIGPGIYLLMSIVIVLIAVIVPAFFSPRSQKPRISKKVAVAIVVALLVIAGLVEVFVPLFPHSPTITINEGELTINSQLTGTQSFTSSSVQQAYVQTVGNGVLTTISRQHGQYNGGDYRVGVFALHNGASAYVVSYDTNNVVVQLKDGSYFVLGPLQQNFTSFLNYFSEDIAPLGNSSIS